MIRKTKDLNKLTDEEFDNIVGPFDNKITDYIKNEIINEYVAYYIYTAFEMDALWDESFRLSCSAAIESLAQLDEEYCDIDRIKSILKNKYSIKVIQDKPTIIEKI